MKKRMTLFFACCAALIAGLGTLPTVCSAQVPGTSFAVNQAVDTLELINGSSQRLKFDYKVPELMVENPEVIQATPVAPDEILVSGLQPGVSSITVSNSEKQLQTIKVHVKVDTRQLERAIKTYFPDSRIEVHPLQTGVILGGNVARADQVSNIMAVARDFFPTNVINQMQVNGSQNIAIKVKIYEVARSKLRSVGIDWSLVGADFGIVSSVSQLIQEFSLQGTAAPTFAGQNLAVGVVSGDTAFNAAIELLEQRNVAKLLDEPVLVAQNGRPAEFLSGGEIPIAVASGLGTNAIEFRAFGTKLDIVPLVHGQGLMTLEVRAEVSEVAPELADASGTPGFRVRRVNTGVKMRAGHTLALAGDYAERNLAETRGVPKIMDNPLLGPLYRKVSDNNRETELVFLITPQFVNDVDASIISDHAPGRNSTIPSDQDLYINGHVEVPECGEDCPVDKPFRNSPTTQPGPWLGQPVAVHEAAPYGASGSVIYSEQAVPAVGSQFDSSFNFPSSGSSRRDREEVADANNGFLWPKQSQSRKR